MIRKHVANKHPISFDFVFTYNINSLYHLTEIFQCFDRNEMVGKRKYDFRITCWIGNLMAHMARAERPEFYFTTVQTKRNRHTDLKLLNSPIILHPQLHFLTWMQAVALSRLCIGNIHLISRGRGYRRMPHMTIVNLAMSAQRVA
jgi:hypothetical protein